MRMSVGGDEEEDESRNTRFSAKNKINETGPNVYDSNYDI